MTKQARRSRFKKFFTVVSIVFFALAIGLVTIGLLTTGAPKAEKSKESGEGNDAKSSSTSSSTESDSDSSQTDHPKIVFDSNGMAEMVVTTNPRTAAAAAAAVLWSVDTTKVQFAEDFREKALTRIMKPSDKYVGVEGQIQTEKDPETGELVYGDPLGAMIRNTATLNYRPTGWWWMLGDQPSFEALRARSAVLKSEPYLVYDSAEIAEVSPKVKNQFTTQYDLQIDKPGATFDMYWVRVEAQMNTGEAFTQRFPTVLAIYCDPPSEGGICGVGALMISYPAAWQLR